jgi:hypothetical protein
MPWSHSALSLQSATGITYSLLPVGLSVLADFKSLDE